MIIRPREFGISACERSLLCEHDEAFERRLSIAFRSLTYREREIIKLRYGLGDGYSYTLKEVGHIFKLTRGRIREIQNRAQRKLMLLL